MLSGSLLKDTEAAEFLGVSPQTVRNWRCTHRGPRYVKFGRSVRYRPEDLLEFINQRTIEPDPIGYRRRLIRE